jgi:hypothetical protein
MSGDDDHSGLGRKLLGHTTQGPKMSSAHKRLQPADGVGVKMDVMSRLWRE